MANASDIRQQVFAATLALAAALEPDERYDPADDPRREAAVVLLGELIDSIPAAEGIAQALTVLGTRRQVIDLGRDN